MVVDEVVSVDYSPSNPGTVCNNAKKGGGDNFSKK